MICYCRPGYTNVGGVCTEIDECTDTNNPHRCKGPSTCANTPLGSYSCSCNAGYGLAADNRTCLACETGTWGVGCKPCNCTDCDPVSGCRSCNYESLTGPNCDQRLDDCVSFNPCSGVANSVCQTRATGHQCVCDSWHLQQLDSCIQADRCRYELVNGVLTDTSTTSRCENAGACINGSLPSSPGTYVCQCRPGFTGDRCQTNIDECSTSSNPCASGGTCVDGENGYSCRCMDDYIGERCQYQAASVDGNSSTASSVGSSVPVSNPSSSSAPSIPPSPGVSSSVGATQPPGSGSTVGATQPPGSGSTGPIGVSTATSKTTTKSDTGDGGISGKELGIILGSIGGAALLAGLLGMCCCLLRGAGGASRRALPPLEPPRGQYPPYGGQMPGYGQQPVIRYVNVGPPPQPRRAMVAPRPPRYRAAPRPLPQGVPMRFNPSRGGGMSGYPF